MRREDEMSHKECYCRQGNDLSITHRTSVLHLTSRDQYPRFRRAHSRYARDFFRLKYNSLVQLHCFKHLTWLEADECKSAPRTFFLLSNSHKNSLLLSLGYEPVPQKKHTSDENIYILSFAYTHQQSHLSLSLVSSTSRLDTASLL